MSSRGQPPAVLIALLGAESTGKSELARQLGDALARDGRSVSVVPEYLREFCESLGRTPRQEEQAGIADEQSRRIRRAMAGHEVVIADTTALMVAVYSEQVFGDSSLYPAALASHRLCHLSLLMGLDLPWQADGWMRDGPHVREPVDALLRTALNANRLPYAVVTGGGPQRLLQAQAAVQRAFAERAADEAPPASSGTPWQWCCDRCGDSGCERRLLLPRLPADQA